MSARSLNKVQLIGNLTRDPNLRYTPNNAAVCSFGIATNRSWTPTDGGEKQESVEFHNVVAWSKLAEICGQLLHKGDKVYVDGRLQTRDWKGDDGQDRRTTEVVIENMILLKSSSGQSDDAVDYDGSGEQMAGAQSASPKGRKAVTSAPKSKSASAPASDTSATLPATDDVDDVEDVADDVPF